MGAGEVEFDFTHVVFHLLKEGKGSVQFSPTQLKLNCIG